MIDDDDNDDDDRLPSLAFGSLHLRGVWIRQYGCFFGKSPKWGGAVIFDPKNYIADIVGFKAVYFGHKFWKKCPKREGEGGGHRQSKKFHCKFTHTFLETNAM